MTTELLGVEQVSEVLGISTRMTYELLRQGLIPALRIGRLWKVTRAGLEQFIAAGGTA